jgi:hypothetical protein
VALVDVKRAADLYAEGWTLREIGAELGVHWSTVSQQLQTAGITMRSGGPPAHPASTQQILQLRDRSLTWSQVAEQVDMTVSGASSRYRRAQQTKPQRLGRWQQVLVDALDEYLAIGVRAAVADHLDRAPPGRSSRLPDEPPTVSLARIVPACFTCQLPMPAMMQVIAPI